MTTTNDSSDGADLYAVTIEHWYLDRASQSHDEGWEHMVWTETLTAEALDEFRRRLADHPLKRTKILSAEPI